MLYKRTIYNKLKQLEETFPVILITGPRQVGKSLVLQEFGKERMDYVSFDDLLARQEAKNDPKLFLEKYKLPLIIDEIQYVPELLSYIKLKVDANRRNGMFFLTGSQKFRLMRGVAESLAGRIAIVDLLGLSIKEIQGRAEESKPFFPLKRYDDVKPMGIKDVYQKIWRGSFPELYKNPNVEWNDFYSAYVKTYIERDIRDLKQVADEGLFMLFLQVVAARTGQLINYENIANEVGVSQPTIKQWISLLETSGIIYILRPYFNSSRKRLVKTAKLYFLDTGLCAYLSGWNTPEVMEKGAMAGEFFETYVVSEIIKSYWHNGKDLRHFYFYRDANQKEIDILMEQNFTLYPIEIKKKSNPDKSDIKAFSTLESLGKEVGQGAVICLCDDWGFITEKVSKVNVGAI